MAINFILGEEKYIDLTVKSKINEPVIITKANWKLKDFSTVIGSGVCEIKNNTISVLLKPQQHGTFNLEVEYTIPPETRIARDVVKVG